MWGSVIPVKIKKRLKNAFNYRVVFMAFIWGGVLTGCAGSANTTGYMTNSDLLDLIQAEKPPVIVDVRSSWEYENGHIPGAVHISFWAAYFDADQISAPRSEPVVVYCEHGPRAGIGKFGLYMAGFQNVIYLQGHMAQWKHAGFVIEK